MDEFDVVVIGAGPAGETAAGRCADGGLSVALVERELIGGECSYWGCIPSKTLIRPGDVLAAAGRVPGAREAVTRGVDVAAAFAQRDYMTSGWKDDGQLPWLAEHHITSAKSLPRRLLVLGGGAVGVEMAQASRRLGCDGVTLLEGATGLLAREEPFAGEEVRMALEAEGITVVVGASVQRVRRDSTDGPVAIQLGDGRSFTADELLVAAGRKPATDKLGVETVGLSPGRLIEVDDSLPAVEVPGGWLYAVGDCMLVIDEARHVLRHLHRAGGAGTAALGDRGDRRRGAFGATLARGAVVSHDQRGVAAPARSLRIVRRLSHA